jgi:DNA end-binding protein Ku
MSILAYADEIVPPTEVDELNGLDDVTVADREVKMAEMLVESLTASFDPDKYHDDYRVQVLDLIARKAAGEEFELPAGANAPPKIVDMMAALEASAKPPRLLASDTRPHARRLPPAQPRRPLRARGRPKRRRRRPHNEHLLPPAPRLL